MGTGTNTGSDGPRLSVKDRRLSFMQEAKTVNAATSEDTPFVAANINACLVEKFTALFEKFFDVNNDGYLTESDVEALNEKIFDHTGWDREDIKSKKLIEYHKDLFKCILAEINKEVFDDSLKAGEVSLNAWLKMWDSLMHKALAIAHLPQWVQVLPYNIFNIMDKQGSGHVTKENLFEFYTDFMGIDDRKGRQIADNAWLQMTGNGDFRLSLDVYTTSFSNFLFGRNGYGPGFFVLGTFPECIKEKGFKLITIHDNE